MAANSRNRDFRAAQRAKSDEFFTSFDVIELELAHYQHHFQGKVVYCNCDDPRASNFFRYFASNFEKLGLKRLITTCYRSADRNDFGSGGDKQAVFFEYLGNHSKHGIPDAEEIGVKSMAGDGDFRSAESIALLAEADIVVTNPPFSLFREFIAQLVEHKKKFLVIGNMNALTYKEIFPLFQANQIWYGPSIRSGDREFRVPESYPLTAAGVRVDGQGNKYVRVKGVRWFTNLDYRGRDEKLELHKTYDPTAYPRYANFDAIEVGKTMEIPVDYPGLMGVPITFMDKYNPQQFDIIGSSRTLGRPMSEVAEKGRFQPGGPRFYLPNEDGTFRRLYDRIVIQRKMSEPKQPA